MANPGDKISPIDVKTEKLKNLPVIKDYYLVLGGGKIGTDFLHYARKNKFPFMLVIDRDENAPASREVQVLKTESEIVDLLKKRAKAPVQEGMKEQLLRAEGKRKEENKESDKESSKESGKKSEAYFYRMDMQRIPFLLSSGIPEYIIPAVPCHAVAYMLADILKFPMQEAKKEESLKENRKAGLPEINSPEKSISEKNSPVNELFIRPEDSELMSFFKTIASVFPEDVIAGSYPEHSMLFFSYAREGEICPDGCPGPRDKCPTFGRKKPKTITEYTRELIHTIPGWVFESHQMKPGIGGLKGVEFKRNMLEIREFVSKLQENGSAKKSEKLEDRAFFIATTCTCHGVLNIFYVT
ncbi:hypothetical protein FXV91_15100 [Methanosarcina sp. DH2]|jgi:hypothetical protein|uniref:hypothetical protein n=1 Tax=Methanosarcina sp. DH2 TaxID=2605639 RepID=UPI001E5D391B|nr:hypothetical protein [Methanosarcina sp. DH2]MCC4771441.1 hypothetical protein [Methanosarcina sp. DH2]